MKNRIFAHIRKAFCLLMLMSFLLCGCSAPDEELFPKALEEINLASSAKIDMDIRGHAMLEGDSFPQVSYLGAKAELTISDDHCSGTLIVDTEGIRLEIPLYIELSGNTSSVYMSLDGKTWLKASEDIDTDSALLPVPNTLTHTGSETEGEVKKYLFDITIPGDAIDVKKAWEVVSMTQNSELFDMDAAELPPLSDMKATVWIDSESGSISRLRVDLAESVEKLSRLLLTKTLESEAEGSGVDIPETEIAVEELIMDIYISEIGTAQAEPIPADIIEKAIDMDAISEERSNTLIAACTYLMTLDLSSESLKLLLEVSEYSEEDIAFALENCNADWDKEAHDYVKHTLSSGGFSEKTLRESMEFEEFEKELIDKAIESNKPDWDKEAADYAAYNISISSISRALMEKSMLDTGFTQEQTTKALDNCGADWDAEAKDFVEELIEVGGYSKALIESTLRELLFEDDQIENALNVDIDWNEQAKLYALLCADQKVGYSESITKYMLTEYAGFNNEQTDYALKNCGIDWNLQAEYAARNHLIEAPYSYLRMIELLREEGFSYEQAVFGADNCGADWYAEALRAGRILNESYGDRRYWTLLSGDLQRAQFTLDQVGYALTECGYSKEATGRWY